LWKGGGLSAGQFEKSLTSEQPIAQKEVVAHIIGMAEK